MDRIEREITVKAPVERVWTVLTEPEHIARWFGDSASGTAEPGGELVLGWKEHGDFPVTIERYEPPKGEGVALIAGTFLSNIGLAVTDFAKQKKVFFLAAEPLTDKITWQNGNRYTFRLRPNTYMQSAMLVPEAAKLKKKRWAIVYPNYEYGQSAAATFKTMLKKLQPRRVVAEQAPRRASTPARWRKARRRKAGRDLQRTCGETSKSVREGNPASLQGREVVSRLTGEPNTSSPARTRRRRLVGTGSLLRPQTDEPQEGLPANSAKTRVTEARLGRRLCTIWSIAEEQEGESDDTESDRGVQGKQ